MLKDSRVLSSIDVKLSTTPFRMTTFWVSVEWSAEAFQDESIFSMFDLSVLPIFDVYKSHAFCCKKEVGIRIVIAMILPLGSISMAGAC